jgi:hypothetical protein
MKNAPAEADARTLAEHHDFLIGFVGNCFVLHRRLTKIFGKSQGAELVRLWC